MRVCIVNATNKVIETQGGARQGTLLQNAINYGFSIDEVTEIEMTEEQFNIDYASGESEESRIRKLIDAKQKELAMAELKKEGKLTANGKLVK